MNIVVLRGRLAAVARSRTLPSGMVIAELDLTTEAVGTDRTSVPVVVQHPAPAVLGLAEGSEVIVVGAVRRRFFRAAGATASRTEVVAATVVPAGRTRQVRTALERAVGAIQPSS
jgi:single-strand DNA-binding protein